MAEIITKESPFSPGKPVQPEYFVARIKEVQRLERAIKQTVSGRNENIFVTGPRGIGKSSLALFLRHLAEKEYSLIGSHCYLGGVRSLESMMGVVFQRLLQDCTDKSLFDKLKKIFSDYIKGVTLFGIGIEITKDKNQLQTLVYNFLPLLQKIYDEAQQHSKKGLVLILDDMNGITNIPQFSPYIKSFVDGLATSRKPLPLLLILVGLPERRDDLIKHQPAVSRIFDIVDMPTMSESDSNDFFTHTFGKTKINVTKKALSMMVEISAGFPTIMHEVGDAVFWQDRDNDISEVDALGGITEAARVAGKKYIEPQLLKLAKNKTYSSILNVVHSKTKLGSTFNRQQILGFLDPDKKKNLDGFLRRSRELGIIETGQAYGDYKFANPLFYLYKWYI